MVEHFAVCSMCRKELFIGGRVFRCSVSTCNSGRVKLVFCSLSCWDAHLPTARHRNASAIDEIARAENRPSPAPATGRGRSR